MTTFRSSGHELPAKDRHKQGGLLRSLRAVRPTGTLIRDHGLEKRDAEVRHLDHLQSLRKPARRSLLNMDRDICSIPFLVGPRSSSRRCIAGEIRPRRFRVMIDDRSRGTPVPSTDGPYASDPIYRNLTWAASPDRAIVSQMAFSTIASSYASNRPEQICTSSVTGRLRCIKACRQ